MHIHSDINVLFAEPARTIQFYPTSRRNGGLQTDTLPVPSPSPTVTSPASPEQINNLLLSPGTSRPKSRGSSNKTVVSQSGKTLLSPSNFNTLNPSADLRLPAEIFASDDSVSDAGATAPEDISVQNMLQESVVGANAASTSTKDKMLGGINIKFEKPSGGKSLSKKSKKATKDNTSNLNLADIKTELQDDFDWNNMTLATVNNNTNVNKFQTR